jgi:hypothetical protein
MCGSVAKASNIEHRINREALNLFWYFISERQHVWYRRVIEGKQHPWTDDEILRKYRFTNVYRQLDPGTQYVIQEILEKDATRRDKIFNVMLYRLIGRLETHDDLGFQPLETFDPDGFEEDLKRRRDDRNETIFTGAYMVAGYNQLGSSDKVENVAHLFGQIASNKEFFDHLISTESAREAYDLIKSQPGFGNFLSYQVLVDLLYPINCYGGDAVLPFSPNEWSSPGPGAQKGLKRLVEDFDGFDRLELMRWLQRNQQQEFSRLDLDFPHLRSEDGQRVELSLPNIQNCLCEFYKYHKILHSDGRARRCFRESGYRSREELRSIYQSAPNFCMNNTAR